MFVDIVINLFASQFLHEISNRMHRGICENQMLHLTKSSANA